jgi:DNA polymerase-3 subunit gamma/tau
MAQALYLKWRPQTFDDIIGQEHIVQTLRHALRSGHSHHAYLLAGPRGTGKTTTARLIAKAVNCRAEPEVRPCNECEICTAINEGRLMDLVEIDAASNTGVDNIRDLLEKVEFRPTQAEYKVYVIDEVHMLSTAAFNALLKTLEEPPAHVIFVLATTEVHRIPETILSRCQRFEFRRIPLQAIADRLTRIAEAESIEIEPEAVELIARTATGSMRDAISLFDQMAAGGSITADYVRLMLGAERREVVRSLLRAWLDQDMSQGLEVINRAVDGGADPRQLARQTADFLRGLLVTRLGAGSTWQDPTADERPIFDEMAREAEPDRLVKAVRLFSEVASQRRAGWQPQLPLELAFVEATLSPDGGSNEEDVQADAITAKPQARSTSKSEPSATRESAAAVFRARSQPGSESSAESSTSESSASESSASASTEASAKTPPERKPDRSPSASKPEAAEAPDESEAEVEEDTPSPSVQADQPVEENDRTPEEADGSDAATSQTLEPELVDKLRQRWDAIVKRIKPVTLGALLRDAHVGGVDDSGRLVLAFRHEFHRDRLATPQNQRQLEDILSQIVDRTVTVRCLMAREWQSEATERVSQVVQTQAEVSLEEDELIRRAQQELGAVPRVQEDA